MKDADRLVVFIEQRDAVAFSRLLKVIQRFRQVNAFVRRSSDDHIRPLYHLVLESVAASFSLGVNCLTSAAVVAALLFAAASKFSLEK